MFRSCKASIACAVGRQGFFIKKAFSNSIGTNNDSMRVLDLQRPVLSLQTVMFPVSNSSQSHYPPTSQKRGATASISLMYLLEVSTSSRLHRRIPRDSGLDADVACFELHSICNHSRSGHLSQCVASFIAARISHKTQRMPKASVHVSVASNLSWIAS